MVNLKVLKLFENSYRVFIVKQGANLSRAKKVNGVLQSNNITNPNKLYLVDKNCITFLYEEQTESTHIEFKNKKYGEFIVLREDVVILVNKNTTPKKLAFNYC